MAEETYTDSTGLNHSLDGARPTKDGRFKGRKYTCNICGLTGRKDNMVWQKGRLVHKECQDEDRGIPRRM